MVMGLLNRVKQCLKGERDHPAKSPVRSYSTSGPLSSFLGPSGRVTLASLKRFFQGSGREAFIEFVQNPVLAGSALNSECFSFAEPSDEDCNDKHHRINKTQIVNLDDQLSKRSGPGTSLPYAIYPLIKRTNSESPAHTFSIGRTKDNDIIMKDMAISKTHAVIRLSKGSFSIEDCGSTNGTRLNGRNIKHKPVLLRDKDVIALGKYEFTFLLPSSLHDLLSK